MKRMIDSELIEKIDKVIDDSGNLEAGKLNRKLYYHPIFMDGTLNSKAYRLTLAILDNNGTAYNATTGNQKIISLLDSGALIQCNGLVIDENDVVNTPYLLYKESGSYYILAHTETSAALFNYFAIVINNFTDGVNEIYPNI